MRSLAPLLSAGAGFVWLWAVAPDAGAGPIEIETRVEHPPETGEITCCDVNSCLGQFTFVQPAGWRFKADKSNTRLVLQAPDFTANLEIVFVLGNPSPGGRVSLETLRQQVGQRFAEAVILEEFTCYTGSHEGLGCDLTWKPSKAFRAMARIAFVPSPGGMLEFCLTTSPDKFADCQPVFGALLTSFSKSSGSKAKPSSVRSGARPTP
jgi:hypothetical protein